jgi:hypothetical protein
MNITTYNISLLQDVTILSELEASYQYETVSL